HSLVSLDHSDNAAYCAFPDTQSCRIGASTRAARLGRGIPLLVAAGRKGHAVMLHQHGLIGTQSRHRRRAHGIIGRQTLGRGCREERDLMTERLTSPPATRVEPVTEVLHGHTIVDPYRWLEDDESPETRAWVDAQNAYTRRVLDASPSHARIRARLETLLSIGDTSAPVMRGERAFFLRREGYENQPKLYLREGDSERVLLDPNQESAEGTTALDWWYPSPDGTLVAFGYSQDGDEESVLQVLDVARDTLLAERIDRTRFCSLAWLPDASGFYYTRYPQPGEVPPGEERYHRKVFFHRLGDDPAADPLVFGDGLPAEAQPHVRLSRDGRWLIVTVSHGWARADLYLHDRTRPEAGFIPVFVEEEALVEGFVHRGQLYLLTNLDAPRYRLLAVDPERPEREHWREIIAEPEEARIEQVVPVG